MTSQERTGSGPWKEAGATFTCFLHPETDEALSIQVMLNGITEEEII